MKTRIGVVASALLLLYSCGSEQKAGVHSGGLLKTPASVLEALTRKKSFSDLFQVNGSISLEATDSSLVAEVTRIAVQDTHIAVLDQVAKQVFLFSAQGKFLRRLGQNGENYQMYASPASVLFIPEKIVVLDDQLDKVIEYSLGGVFSREVKLGFRPRFLLFSPGTGRLYAFVSHSGKKRVIVLDKDYREVGGFGSIDPVESRGCYLVANKVCFLDSASNYWLGSISTSRIFIYNSAGQQLGAVDFKKDGMEQDPAFKEFNQKYLDLRELPSSLPQDELDRMVSMSATVEGAWNIGNRYVLIHRTNPLSEWAVVSMDGQFICKSIASVYPEEIRPEQNSVPNVVGVFENGIIVAKEGKMSESGAVENPVLVYLKAKL